MGLDRPSAGEVVRAEEVHAGEHRPFIEVVAMAVEHRSRPLDAVVERDQGQRQLGVVPVDALAEGDRPVDYGVVADSA